MKKNFRLACLVAAAVAATFGLLVGCDDGEQARKPYLTEYKSGESLSLNAAEDILGGAGEDTVAYYKFNEGSGGIVYDETGKHNGVIVNGGNHCRKAGKYGNALEFKTNRNQYVYVEDSPDLSPMSFTVEMIVKFDASARYIPLQRLLFKDWSYNVFLENTGDPYLNFNLYTETNTAWETAKVRLNGEVFDGKYHHIAFCYDGVTGLTRGYFDYFCEDSVYLSAGIIMPSVKNNPLYIGSGFWAERVQQASTVTYDALKISSSALYAYDFIGTNVETDNWQDEMQNEVTEGTLVHNITLSSECGNRILDADGTPLGNITGEADYSGGGIFLEQGSSEASFSVNQEAFRSGNFSVQVVVKLDESNRPDPYTQLDGTVIYKENDFMICTYVYDIGNGMLGYLVTFRLNIAEAGLISVENQMCVNYNLYDGKTHHLALNYNSATSTMDGYIDYKKVVSKNFAGVSNQRFVMTDSPVLLGRSLNNWQGDGVYSNILLTDGVTAAADMYGYGNKPGVIEPETGELVADIRFQEKGAKFSIDKTSFGNDLFLLGGAQIVQDGDERVLSISKEGTDAGYIRNSVSLNSSSVSVILDVKMNGNISYGLHRLVFKDFQYDVCLDIKSGGVNVTSKINTRKDGWLTRVSGRADALLDGDYHRIALVYNSTQGYIALYLDGKEISREHWEGAIVFGTSDLYVGSGYWGGALQQGSLCTIDNLKIYNYAISEDLL